MQKKVLITGGAGFIGINCAKHYLDNNFDITILDDFSRLGSRENVRWLKNNYSRNLKVIEADITKDNKTLLGNIKNIDIILHLAAQVAVTGSIKNPKKDFEINSLGTLNVLEAVRIAGNNPILIYSSTNKVYGDLSNKNIIEKKNRYEFKNLPYGISEEENLDFYSPYGCSKGAAEQYVRDYNRIYGFKTVVFRQSCIYGPHQFGVEDQGWVAWFIIASIFKKSITIYGTGKQVRDLLYIDDLIRAYDFAIKAIDKTKGKIYNIGGGNKNTLSIWFEFKPLIERLIKRRIRPRFKESRLGDQKIYVSDIRLAKKDFGWEPNTNIVEGIEKLYKWVIENKEMIKEFI